MGKDSRKASRGKQRGRPGERAQRRVGLKEILVSTRACLREVALSSGLQVLASMLEEDRERLCGARSQPSEQRQAYRHGHDEAPVVLGGRKVRVPNPRARSVKGEELELPTWRQMTEEDPLDERVVEQMLVGVSTRGYARSLEPTTDSWRAWG
jgi:hypothetical protein